MILSGECIHALAAIDEVDHFIMDPPYLAHTHNAQRQGCTGYVEPTRPNATRAQFNRARVLGFDHLSDEDRTAICWETKRLVKRWAIVFSDHEGSMLWADELQRVGMQYVRTCVWIKRGAAPQFTGDRPAAGHECIVLAHQTHPNGKNKKKQWNGGGKHGVYTYPIVLNRGSLRQRLHTAQKPLSLMEQLVLDFTDEGELICDPYCGSGTTLVAAKLHGRRSLGIDLNAEAAAIRMKAMAECQDLDTRRKIDRELAFLP